MEKSRAGTKNIIQSSPAKPASVRSQLISDSFYNQITISFSHSTAFWVTRQLLLLFKIQSLPGSLLDIERGAKTLTRLLVIHCPIQMNINGDILIILTSSPGNGFGNGTRWLSNICGYARFCWILWRKWLLGCYTWPNRAVQTLTTRWIFNMFYRHSINDGIIIGMEGTLQ